jgi:ElaB/YqjD/DUF883 family membrane-anchored ribosome-binding protein
MNEISDDVAALADDAGAFMASTASAAGKRYDEARKSLTSVLDRGRDIYGLASKRAARDARAADHAMHANLYQTVLIGIGVGVLLGYLVARQSSCAPD